MKTLILMIVITITPLAKGQQIAPQQLSGRNSIKGLAMEIGPNYPAPEITVIASPNSKPKGLVKGLSPVWSPNGDKIVYCVRDGHGFGQTQVMNADGSGKMQLTKLKGGACPTDWSPDGEKIVLTTYGDKTASILVMSKNGENPKGVAQGYGARWSPDGRQLVFCHAAERRGESNSIWFVNADGTGLTKVIEDNSPVLDVAWFPDGKSIAFSSVRESKNRSALFRVRLDGTGLEAVAVDRHMSLFFPIVSPDGTEVLADAYQDSPDEGSIVLFDLASHHGSVLTQGKHPSVLWQKP